MPCFTVVVRFAEFWAYPTVSHEVCGSGSREGPGSLHVQVSRGIGKHGGVCMSHTTPKHLLSSLPSSDQGRLWGGHLCYQRSASPCGAHLHHRPGGRHHSNKLLHLLQCLCCPQPPGLLLLSGIRYWPKDKFLLSLLSSSFPRTGPVSLWKL